MDYLEYPGLVFVVAVKAVSIISIMIPSEDFCLYTAPAHLLFSLIALLPRLQFVVSFERDDSN